MDRTILTGHTILVMERQPLIALDLQTALEEAGAEVVTMSGITEALSRVGQSKFTAAVIDWRPDSDEHRKIARALKRARVPFLFHATQAPEDVTTVRGVPILLKPARPEEIVKAVALLTRRSR